MEKFNQTNFNLKILINPFKIISKKYSSKEK